MPTNVYLSQKPRLPVLVISGAFHAMMTTRDTARAGAMEIAEDNAQRVTLDENAGPLAVFLLFWFLVFGALCAVHGLWLLFRQVSEIAAPAWAETHHLIGHRWRREGSDVPLSLAVSVAMSGVVVAFGLVCLWLGGARLLLSIRQRLVFDFMKGQVILNRRGVLRCPDRIHPLSGILARIEVEEDSEDGSKYHVLRVEALPGEGKRGWLDLRPWQRSLWSERVKPEQLEALRWLIQRCTTAR
jgi:hypothetical protein